jgi:hypothetical protein
MLHVTNGDSAGSLIAAAGLPGEVMAWRDVLHEGPLPEGLDAAELRATRAAFLAACGCGTAEQIEADLRARDERLAAAARSGEEIVLWFEHDLYDQLQLLQVLDALDGAAGIEAILTDRHLGAMQVDEIAALWPWHAPVQAGQRAVARLAWAAVRAPDPHAMEALLATYTAALPHLAPALRRLLQELPSTADGLSRTEHAALAALADGPRTPVELLHAVAQAEEAAFMGDTWLWRRLEELGSGERPLVQAAGGGQVGRAPAISGDDGFAHVPIELTSDGRAVLAGDADRAELVPLDRWVGGIRLEGTRPAWRWDRARGRSVGGRGGASR